MANSFLETIHWFPARASASRSRSAMAPTSTGTLPDKLRDAQGDLFVQAIDLRKASLRVAFREGKIGEFGDG